jgi:hypothetical protein
MTIQGGVLHRHGAGKALFRAASNGVAKNGGPAWGTMHGETQKDLDQ